MTDYYPIRKKLQLVWNSPCSEQNWSFWIRQKDKRKRIRKVSLGDSTSIFNWLIAKRDFCDQNQLG